MALGIDLGVEPPRAERLQRYAFDHGLIVELCGRRDEVIKLLPPLTIEPAVLDRGLDVLRRGLRSV
jgi:diaminobutyrate-2-oxoglutarate transaminase